VSGEALLITSNAVKPLGSRGSAPDPTGGGYSGPLDFLPGGEGADCPSARTLPPLSALRASNLVAFSHSLKF